MLAARPRAAPPLIYAVADLTDLEQDPPVGAPAASELVERALAALAVELVAAGARRLLVAGGETSGAVVSALGVRTLSIGAPRSARSFTCTPGTLPPSPAFTRGRSAVPYPRSRPTS